MKVKIAEKINNISTMNHSDADWSECLRLLYESDDVEDVIESIEIAINNMLISTEDVMILYQKILFSSEFSKRILYKYRNALRGVIFGPEHDDLVNSIEKYIERIN